MKKSTQQWTAFVFGVVFVLIILAIAIFFPEPTPFQYMVFRIVLALAAAGVGAMIPGIINVSYGGVVRAGGAIALFVVVYFFNPAQYVVQSPKLKNSDFRVRFSIVRHDLTTNHIELAPPVLRCKGRLGIASMEFDLVKQTSLNYASTRSRPMPMIQYESEHFSMPLIKLVNVSKIESEHFTFTLPSELRRFPGTNTQFQAELWIGSAFYVNSPDRCESGTVDIDIHTSPNKMN